MKVRMGKGRQPPFRRLVLLTALVGTMSGAGSMAIAQSSAPADTKKSATEAMELQEIVVTAERVSRPLQKTPIAVTAFTLQDLEVNRVSSLPDLMDKVPSVQLRPFAGNRASPNMYIRGMGSTDAQTTKDPAVTVYIDGVVVGRAPGLAADVADLERVEVLRGPQGTLYGRNTTAGAINFITVKPEKDFSFEQQLTAGNYDLFSTRTRVNVPLSDTLFTRLAYMHSTNAGWVENHNSTLTNQVNYNKEDKEAIKWAFRLLATDRFTADYSMDQSKIIYGNQFWQLASDPRMTVVNPSKGLMPSNVKVSGHNLTLAWDFGGPVLKSITAYRKMDFWSFANYTDVFVSTSLTNQDQISQEFQLIGDAMDKRINYVAGLFFYKEKAYESSLADYGPTLKDYWSIDAQSHSKALFGQVTWTPPMLSDRLRLTLGLRDTQDSREATKNYINAVFFPSNSGKVIPVSKDFSKTNGSLTADYAFTNAVNGYAKVSTAYRAGGFNSRSTVPGFQQGFGPENVRATELGLKSDLWDKRLRLNVAAFVNKYSDMQVDQSRTPSQFTDTLNAGKATVKGQEVEATAILTEGLTAKLFYSHLDGKYGSYLDNGVDLSSVKVMSATPKGAGGLGLKYSTNKLSLGKLSFDLDYTWTDDYYSGVNPNTLNRGYNLWNARMQLADIKAAKGTVRVAGWVKNIADKTYTMSTIMIRALSSYYGEPRTVGLDLTYDFY